MKLERGYESFYTTGKFVGGRKEKHYYFHINPKSLELSIAFYDSYRRCHMLQTVAYINPSDKCEFLQTFWEIFGISQNKRIRKEHERLWETLKEQKTQGRETK
jgi:hypothetical protein